MYLYLDLCILYLFTNRIRSTGKGNVFTGVCHSVHNWGWGGVDVWSEVWVSGQEGPPIFTGGVSHFSQWGLSFFTGGSRIFLNMGDTPSPNTVIRSMRGRYASYGNQSKSSIYSYFSNTISIVNRCLCFGGFLFK